MHVPARVCSRLPRFSLCRDSCKQDSSERQSPYDTMAIEDVEVAATLRLELKAWENEHAAANGGKKPGREVVKNNAAIGKHRTGDDAEGSELTREQRRNTRSTTAFPNDKSYPLRPRGSATRSFTNDPRIPRPPPRRRDRTDRQPVRSCLRMGLQRMDRIKIHGQRSRPHLRSSDVRSVPRPSEMVRS